MKNLAKVKGQQKTNLEYQLKNLKKILNEIDKLIYIKALKEYSGQNSVLI